jgi:uncharacterized protein YecE (DUF72 family)
VDRHDESAEWAELLAKVAKRGVLIYGYANNHYAGHAPASVELFSGRQENCQEIVARGFRHR